MGFLSTTPKGHVAVVEIHRGPNNFFDEELLGEIAAELHRLGGDPAARAVVLCSEGKHFCAGADLRGIDAEGIRRVYRQAFAIFTARVPIVAAIQGAAVGGGLGLALAADFRVAGPNARFSANFARLGFHHGFGLSVTLPDAVGQQAAAWLLYTGRRIAGEEAHALGLCDRLAATTEQIRAEALAMAVELAAAAPLSVRAIRATMRGTLPARVREAVELERKEQDRLRRTGDFAEGVAASGERREPRFKGS